MRRLTNNLFNEDKEMSIEEKKLVLGALDMLAMALTGTGHVWTDEERDSYLKAVKLLEKTDPA